jgi:hypothetical protein
MIARDTLIMRATALLALANDAASPTATIIRAPNGRLLAIT